MDIDIRPLCDLPPPFGKAYDALESFRAAEKAFDGIESRFSDTSADCHVLSCYLDGTADDEMIQRVCEIAEMEAIIVDEDDIASPDEARILLEEYEERLTEWEPELEKAQQAKVAAQKAARRAMASALLLAKRSLRASGQLPPTGEILFSGCGVLAKRDVEDAYGRLRGAVREWLVERQRMKELRVALAPLADQFTQYIEGGPAEVD
jgi:hypothetical protein